MQIRPVAVLAVLALVLQAGCQSTSTPKLSEADEHKMAEIDTELGVQYMLKGEYDVALNRLNKAIMANPNYAEAYNALGLLDARIGRVDDAERNFKEALRLDPSNSSALNNYGQFLCQRNRFDEGEKLFLKAVKNPLYRNPEYAYTNAGTCALAQGKLDAAENHLRAALLIDSKLAPALIQMADVSFRLKRYLPARAYLQRYLEVAKHTAQTLWLGIRIERELGDKDTEASYALQLEKNFPDSNETKLLLESKSK